MAARARQALGSAYLHQHLAPEHAPHDASSDCRDVHPHLAGFVRGTVGSRRRRRLEAHLATCAACNDARSALGRVNKHLRIVPFIPLHLGRLGAASVSIKVQVVTWLSDAAAPMATSGALAIGALMPTIVADSPALPHPRAAAVAEASFVAAPAGLSATVQQAVAAVVEAAPAAVEAASSPLAAADTDQDDATATVMASVRPQPGGSEAPVDAVGSAALSVGDGETPSIVFELLTTAMASAPSALISAPTAARLVAAADAAPTGAGSALDDARPGPTGSATGAVPGRAVSNGQGSTGPDRGAGSGRDATTGGTTVTTGEGPSAGDHGDGGAVPSAGHPGDGGANDATAGSGDEPSGSGGGDTTSEESGDGAPGGATDGSGAEDGGEDEGTDAGDDGNYGDRGNDDDDRGHGNGQGRDNGGRGHDRGDDDGGDRGHGNGHGRGDGGHGTGRGNGGGIDGGIDEVDTDVPPVVDDAGNEADDSGDDAPSGGDGGGDIVVVDEAATSTAPVLV